MTHLVSNEIVYVKRFQTQWKYGKNDTKTEDIFYNQNLVWIIQSSITHSMMVIKSFHSVSDTSLMTIKISLFIDEQHSIVKIHKIYLTQRK